MKKISFFAYLFLLLNISFAFAQQKDDAYLLEIQAYQQELNTSYKSEEKTPLSKTDLANFKEHSFFDINKKYCIKTKIVKSKNEKPFGMPTTVGSKAEYVKYGEAHFKIDGKKYKLNIYQSVKVTKGYENYLFLPFRDLTNGTTTYEGGRFLDFKIPENDKNVVIDFNKAYNPYCAYSDNYACPIVPKENSLSIEILSGIKLLGKK